MHNPDKDSVQGIAQQSGYGCGNNGFPEGQYDPCNIERAVEEPFLAEMKQYRKADSIAGSDGNCYAKCPVPGCKAELCDHDPYDLDSILDNSENKGVLAIFKGIESALEKKECRCGPGIDPQSNKQRRNKVDF